MKPKIIIYTIAALLTVFCACKKSNSGGIETPTEAVKSSKLVLDESFIVQDNTWLYAAVQSDGKIVVANSQQIKRLNKDGSTDNTFTTSAVSDGEIKSLTVQSNGKIWVTGTFMAFNGHDRLYIVRLNDNGTEDRVGTLDSIKYDANSDRGIYALAFQPNGKIFLAGDFFYYTGSNYNNDVYHLRQPKGIYNTVWLNTNGTLDGTSFKLLSSGTRGLKMQTDGKMLVTGNNVLPAYYSVGNSSICRLMPGGAADEKFNMARSLLQSNNASSYYGTGRAIAIQDDGRILIGGTFNSYGSSLKDANQNIQGIVRLSGNDGLIDFDFKPPVATFQDVNSVALGRNGKIFVGSSKLLNDFKTPLYQGFTVLNTDGTIDNTVQPGFLKYGQVYSIVKESENSFLVVGQLVQDINNPTNKMRGIVRIKYE